MLHSTHSSLLRGLREEERRGEIERWRELKGKREKVERVIGKMPTERAERGDSR